MLSRKNVELKISRCCGLPDPASFERKSYSLTLAILGLDLSVTPTFVCEEVLMLQGDRRQGVGMTCMVIVPLVVDEAMLRRQPEITILFSR